MADHPVIEVPIASQALFSRSELGEIKRGRTRNVPGVKTNGGTFPCIWRSHETIMADVNGDGHPIPANDCILLVTRHPLVFLRAEVDVNAWSHFDDVPVEW